MTTAQMSLLEWIGLAFYIAFTLAWMSIPVAGLILYLKKKGK